MWNKENPFGQNERNSGRHKEKVIELHGTICHQTNSTCNAAVPRHPWASPQLLLNFIGHEMNPQSTYPFPSLCIEIRSQDFHGESPRPFLSIHCKNLTNLASLILWVPAPTMQLSTVTCIWFFFFFFFRSSVQWKDLQLQPLIFLSLSISSFPLVHWHMGVHFFFAITALYPTRSR